MKQITFICFILMSSLAFAQRGPGGVSDDNDTQKNCRLWLDAGDLTDYADGDAVNVWHDKSLAAVDDSAFWDPDDADKYLQPTYRDAPSAGINGKPVVSYENGGMLKIGKWDGGNGPPASPDLNSNTPGYQTTYEQTVFVAFRTANNVTDRQVLWEEGGYNRGFKIYIRDEFVFIAAYDDANDNDPGSPYNVPHFGFSYKKQPVQPNTTYVLSLVYDVPTGADNNVLITNTSNPNPSEYTGLTGTLNGNPFPSNMEFGCCEQEGVGGIGYHPDPIGLGGLNRTSYDESGQLRNKSQNTGSRLFQGRLAEVCYYAFAMNDAERIIVENYLAAKYFANVIYNDKFDYEAAYGDGVIGVGKEQYGVIHNISQGDNLFEISVDMSTAFPDNSPYYLLVGHDNNQITWTNQNTPDTASIQRLRRIWRWDRHNTTTSNKKVTIKLYPQDIAKLPPLPSGYTKYGILQEHTSTYLPNFNPANATVTELFDNGSFREAKVNIEKGEFFTLCAIKPSAEFEILSDYAIESDPPPADFSKRAKILLNYKPTSSQPTTVGVKFVDGTAVTGTDYNPAVQATATFAPFQDTTSIGFNIINNIVVTAPPTKNFKIILDAATSDPGLTIGARDTLDFSIYDDDPTPKITFVIPDTTISENAGMARIRVQVLGHTTAPTTARVIRPDLSAAGTATYDQDYTLPAANSWYPYNSTMRRTVTIPAGTNQTASVYFPILNDSLDEYDQTVKFTLQPVSGVGAGTGSILNHTVTIIDDDVEPTVSFATASSEGYEAINNPRLYLVLNTPSEKKVTVDYAYTGGTATPSPNASSDFSSPPSGTIVFPAGSDEEYFNLIVYANDSTPETDNTVIFDLSNPVNAVLSSPSEHTYTIKDYSGFEWQGVAGVGTFKDNTYWMVPDGATSGVGANSIPNLSPRPIDIIQDVNGQRPTVTTPAAGLNNHKMVEFDGSQNLKINGSNEGQSPLINMGGQYDRKSFFFVITPDVVNSNTPQVIYEQGGGGNGLSIYIIQNKLYFYVWSTKSGAYSPWGLVNNSANNHNYGQAYVESATNLQAGHTYIVSCHYSRNWGYTVNNMPPLAGLHMYINGVLEDSYTTDSNGDYRVGRLYTHSGYASIGAMWYQGKVHTNPGKGPTSKSTPDYYFHGKLGEFLYFNEPSMTEARVRILHNYLASKYDLPLSGGNQDFDLNYADNTSSTYPDFNYQMAGIGQEGTSVHGDSQGMSELRVTNPVIVQNPAFLNWGNNGENLTATWPYSNTQLPASINERSGKVWKFMENPAGGITKADFLISFRNTQNAATFQQHPEYLKLLVNTSGDPNDFSTATVYTGQILNGNVIKFSSVNISDGMYATLGNTSIVYPLPIELLNFAAKLNGNVVDINWATASEKNNAYFLVERAGSDLHWKEIAKVSGAGNSNTTLYYNDKDRQPLPGISYYRLKQVDFDGKYKYSDVVSVVNNSNNTSDDIYIFPNPSNSGSVFVRMPSAFAKGSAQISIFTLSGMKVRETQLRGDAAIRELHYGDLKPGIYMINIRTSLLNETKKLVIQ